MGRKKIGFYEAYAVRETPAKMSALVEDSA